MVRNILVKHVSSVALDSIFSTRVTMLDTYRSSLGPKVAEVLICSQSWLKPIEEFEITEDVVAGALNLFMAFFICYLLMINIL